MIAISCCDLLHSKLAEILMIVVYVRFVCPFREECEEMRFAGHEAPPEIPPQGSLEKFSSPGKTANCKVPYESA